MAAVLVPYDGSKLSQDALEFACERFPEADITALFIVDTTITHQPEQYVGVKLGDIYEQREAEGEELLADAEALADEYDKTPAQIVLRWAVEKDVVVLPKSSSAAHVVENADLFGWELAPADHRRIDELDRQEPVYDTLTRDWSRDVYGIPE